MSVQIIQDYIPKGRRNRPGYNLKPRYITIHSTANTSAGAGARGHASYLKGAAAANAPVSWHFSVDGGVGKVAPVIVQHLPLNENGWHAGDGASGTGNRQSIGIEICENRDGDQAVAIRNAAWLTAKLMKEHGIPLDRVVQHNRWNGKNCPRILRSGSGWNNFLGQVRGFLSAGSSSGDQVIRTIEIHVNGKKTSAIGYLINNTTHVPVGFVVDLFGGEVTGHGDHIRITTDFAGNASELAKQLEGAQKRIADAVKLLTG